MKLLIAILLSIISFTLFGQYSNYYEVYHSGEVKVKSEVEVEVNKTITTIDYGALAQANALAEKNRLEKIRYNDDISRSRALEIASDPLKAFNYGRDNNWELKRKDDRYGIKSCIYYHKIPHKSLFTSTSGYTYRNESLDGVVTIIDFDARGYLPLANQEHPGSEYFGRTEDFIKEKGNWEVGTRYTSKGFIHKNEINRATVFTHNGFFQTLAREDDYEKIIEDKYVVITKNGFFYSVIVTFKGSKNSVTFEQLEGRRYYMGRLCRQMVATAKFKDIKMHK